MNATIPLPHGFQERLIGLGELPGRPFPAVLAAHTGSYLWQGAEPRRGDSLPALLAVHVPAPPEPLESLGEPVSALEEEPPNGEAGFPFLTQLGFVGRIREGIVVTDRPGKILDDHSPA